MECLNCKKDFDNKKPTARYCSVSCRVLYNRRNKIKPIEKVDKNLDIKVLYNEMFEMIGQIRNSIGISASRDGAPVGSAIGTTTSMQIDREAHYRHEEPGQEYSYNDILDLIPSLTSVEDCERWGGIITKSDMAGWQKNSLLQLLQKRSQHPDLN